MTNPVRTSAEYVVKHAKDVFISKERLQSLAHRLAGSRMKIPGWSFDFHLNTKDENQMLDYIVLIDTFNFCFWSQKGPRWEFEYKGKKWNGYFALALALKSFFEENPEKGNLKYFKDIPFVEFKKIFQGGNRLQFLRERWQYGKRVSAQILKKYGSSKNLVLKAEQMFSKLVPEIAKLPSFNDTAKYKGKKVYILKRAQVLGGDIMGEFNNKGIGHFVDPEYITAFADYKIPQILHSWGVLEYSSELEKKIKSFKLIPAGLPQEVEIRCATIWAVELLRKELEKLGMEVYSYQIDWLLWNESQRIQLETPYHRTPTIFY